MLIAIAQKSNQISLEINRVSSAEQCGIYKCHSYTQGCNGAAIYEYNTVGHTL